MIGLGDSSTLTIPFPQLDPSGTGIDISSTLFPAGSVTDTLPVSTLPMDLTSLLIPTQNLTTGQTNVPWGLLVLVVVGLMWITESGAASGRRR